MYDQKHIQAYNDHYDSFSAIWAVVKHFRSQPIGFGNFLAADGGDKCAIHIPVFQEDTGGGCGAIGIGNHPSIASLYDAADSVYCHADEGARVIDFEFASKVARLDDEFVSVALRRSGRFVKRYVSGGLVEWTRYGRGYCYLQLVHPNVRHRVARILGPFPLVADVMRFVIVVGNWGSRGFFLERMSASLFHVRSHNWSPGTSLRSIIKFAITLGSFERIGGAVASSIRDIGYSEVFRGAGYFHGLPRVSDVREFLANVPRSRLDAMLAWMSEHHIVGSDDVLAYLLVATSALAALNVPGVGSVKTKVRMWQVFGDIVCKHFVAMHVLATDGTVEDYSRLTGKGFQCNRSMSLAVVASDLFGACAAPGLSLESKAWADILEGVIGVIAMTQSVQVLGHCLAHFGLVPSGIPQVKFQRFPSAGDLPHMNSGDWKRAAELFMRGKL